MVYSERREELVLPSTSVIQDAEAGGTVEVDLTIAGDGLYIFDRDGNRLHFWRYADIVDAGPDRMLVRLGRPDIRLTVGGDVSYETIIARAPHLRRPPGGVLMALPDRATRLFGFSIGFLALALLGFLILSWIASLFA